VALPQDNPNAKVQEVELKIANMISQEHFAGFEELIDSKFPPVEGVNAFG
jgi:hypothetical protein